jgi:hypothetical protein
MHVIRLRSPWRKQIEGEIQSRRVDVPDCEQDEGKQELATGSAVLYRRRFNRPTGLQPDNHVWLRVSDWSGSLHCVLINHKPLVSGGVIKRKPFELDITAYLALHNELEIRLVANPDQKPCLHGEVSLGID